MADREGAVKALSIAAREGLTENLAGQLTKWFDAELAAGQTHTVEISNGELAGFQGTLEQLVAESGEEDLEDAFIRMAGVEE